MWYSGSLEKVEKSDKISYFILYHDRDKEKATTDEVA